MILSLRHFLSIALGILALAECSAAADAHSSSARLLAQRLSALMADCKVLAAKENGDHGIDELAQLPSVCASLGSIVKANAAQPNDPSLASRFVETYESCLSIAKHRGAMFTYRGHPGNPRMYHWVRKDCDAYASAYRKTGSRFQKPSADPE
ncbi:MAG TPA: hypothetical protein VFC78_15755 [Tepidisphaeraceae bacterium]|nr:hypothetical protein [Tepidisphaeraceae bacterium]